MPAHFENDDKCDGSKFELAFTRCRNNLKTVGILTVKTSLQTLMQKKYAQTIRIDKSRSKSVEKCSVFIILECSHDVVSKIAG